MELPIHYPSATFRERRLVRMEYISRQGGNCHHCGSPLSGEPAKNIQALRVDARRFPGGFFSHPVHLHHSHKSGMTIGAVHAKCNAVLWQYHGE